MPTSPRVARAAATAAAYPLLPEWAAIRVAGSVPFHAQVKRTLFRFFRPYLNRLARGFVLRKCNGDVNLNLACGASWKLEGWIGIDSSWAYAFGPPGKYDLDHDLLLGLPFEDNSVARIFSSHFIEHLTLEEAQLLLADCFRALRPGGVLRLVLPDLELFIRALLQEDESFLCNERIIGGPVTPSLVDNFLLLFYSAPSWNNACHKYAYSFKSLSYHLKIAGFVGIEKSAHMNSKFPEFNRPEFDSIVPEVPHFSLYVDATKPGDNPRRESLASANHVAGAVSRHAMTRRLAARQDD